MAVTQSILEIALRHAQKAGARRITDIHLVIGQFSSYIDESVQFYWDMICRETPAEGAQLHFRRVPAELRCLDCQHIYMPVEDRLSCPRCESTRVAVIAGEEFSLEAIDVEMDGVSLDPPGESPK